MPETLKIATRQSPLALWQANHIAKQLLQIWPALRCELVPLVTSGDTFQRDRLQALGGKGLFIKELEEALLDGRADIAVHSTKDMPAALPPGLSLSVICKRDNPLDALVSKQGSSLDTLPPQATVGTASLRRQSQLLAHRPDLKVQTLRGNIHTRLEKLTSGPYDAIILAAAGLERMKLSHVISQWIPDTLLLPACAQGALCIESRVEDTDTQALIAPLNDPLSSLCVQTERQVNAELGGNCHLPLAVFCKPTMPGQLLLRARLLSPDGRRSIEDSQTGKEVEAQPMAMACVKALLARGAGSILAAL